MDRTRFRALHRSVTAMIEERRLWRDDNMAWAMAPAEIEAGETFAWAGKSYRVVQAPDKSLRIREIKSKAE